MAVILPVYTSDLVFYIIHWNKSPCGCKWHKHLCQLDSTTAVVLYKHDHTQRPTHYDRLSQAAMV